MERDERRHRDDEPAAVAAAARARERRARRDRAYAVPVARAVCSRCRRPESVCYCAALTSIDTVTRVVILQHPREKDMPIGTARMAALCLPQARLHVGVDWDGSDVLRDATSDPARPAILLWPGPGARDILTEPPAGPVTLIVVDGTWSQAKSLVRDNPVLRSLPRYAFHAPEPTHYRIRREPRAEYVSTIEALMHVLGALEGDPERFRALLGPMHAMVDAHLARQHSARRLRHRTPRPRRGPYELLPPQLTGPLDDLVCIAAEGNSWPYSAPERALGDELVHWVARRLGTGATFDVAAAPRKPLSPTTSHWTGLDDDRLRGGVPHSELVAAFGRFTRPTDVICTWGWHGPRLFRDCGGTLPATVIDLRAVARRITNPQTPGHRRVGSLEEYAAWALPADAASEAGPAAATSPASGRSGQRLGLLVRIVEAWRREADRTGAAAGDVASVVPPM